MSGATAKDIAITASQTTRTAALTFEKQLQDMKQAIAKRDPATDPQGFDRGEVLANITLAYRHIEDARMRLGKVIQAADGGVSIYDKPKEEKN